MNSAALVRESFARVAPQGERFAAGFYANLFAEYPETRALFFGTDLEGQHRLLASALALLVESLDDEARLAGALRVLGTRYAGFGVSAVHYGIFAEVLLRTLEVQLGDAWTHAARQAWVDACVQVVGMMMEGAGAAAAHAA